MMKKAILFVCILIGSLVNAQDIIINPCGTYERMEELGLLPEYKENLLNSELIRAQEGTIKAISGVVYRIPVVYHILHDGGESNITYEQIVDGLRILNEDYRLLNPDAGDVSPAFVGMPTDVEVEFVLATKAPNGDCFTGVTRTYNPTAANDGNVDQVQTIKFGNDIYNGDWPGNKYLNIFVVGSLSDPGSNLITLGYTTYPQFGGLSMSNGFHVIHQCIGSIGTGGVYGLATSTHEIGHWLNLPHTWGSNNNPGNASSCNTDDGVADTPRCIGIQGGPCQPTNPNPLNSCDQDNAYWGFDIQDNIENYMDYAHCDKMFTQGQVDVMRGALNSSVGGRNNLWTPANLAATGADGNLYLCEADFNADKLSICAGEQIQFSDESFNVVNGWTWSFPGGTPATSTDQNPLITYDTPGLYEVTLEATDGSNNDTETKTTYIQVSPIAGELPIHEGFEGYSTLNNINEWRVQNPDNNAAFELSTSVGLTGTQCAMLSNFGQASGSYDSLISAPANLSTLDPLTDALTLSFRFAYKRRSLNDDDYFRVMITKNCGESWATRRTLHGEYISSAVQATPFTPTSAADWTTVHMTNVTSSYWVENFRYMFTFASNGGNNMYIDDINIYAGTPSDNLVIGLNENETLDGLSVYPNPADDELSVRFSVNAAQIVSIQIQDVSGKIVQKNAVQANEGSNLVFMDTGDLAGGMYFLQIAAGDTMKTIQFVVK